jgi:CBS domain-containing protein
VRQILESKTQNLNTVNENAPISLAAKIMVSEEVGSLMVTSSDGSLTGIVTERDYIRASQNEAGNIVRDIMTSREKLVTVTADTTLTACATLMAQHQFRHLPVVEGRNLVGLIGSRALLFHFLQYHEIQVAHLEGFLPYPVW